MRRSFDSTEQGMALLQILRCVDSETFYNYIYENAGQERPEAEQHGAASLLYGWGLNEALSLFWDGSASLPGLPAFKTTTELHRWGDSVLKCSGRVRLIEQFLELDRIQLGSLSQSEEDANTFDFCFASNAIGIESVERDEGNYFAKKVSRFFEQTRAWEKLEQRRPEVMQKMQSLVDVSRDHFIRYDTTPEIDTFYSDYARLLAPTREGWEAFPLNARFGGAPFVDYIECVRILMGFALKHIDYCILLTNRHRNINPADIVAVPCRWTDACRFLSYAMDESEADAERLMEMTAVNCNNSEFHFKTPAGPLAPHYRVGKDWVIRLVTGCLHNPFHFMLRELKRRCPADWDKAVDSREDLFRIDLAHEFSRFNGVLFHPASIDISTSLGKTDIDVFAYDRENKTVGLFQLKWQDPFCGSMRERESKKRNLLVNGNEWVGKVSEWASGPEMTKTLIGLGMPKQEAANIKSAKLFVLGRNFSKFSGEFQTDLRAAWGHWSQVQRLLEGTRLTESPFEKLFELMQSENPSDRTRGRASVSELRVGPIIVKIHPAA